MKIRKTFLLAVLLLFVNEIQGNGGSLNSLIEELAPIARLTNGIAIETELSADANKMNDVVAEFLRVGSGDDVAKLKELRVDEVAKELGELYATVEKVPELNVDMAALADTFKALETMKQGSEVLSRNLTDPSDELQRDLHLGKTIHAFHLTDLSNLKKTADELEFVMSNENFESVGNVHSDHLVPLDSSLKNMITYLANFEMKFDPLLKLQNISEKLQGFREMAKLSKLFVDNFKMLSSMGTKLNEVQTGVSSLKTLIDTKKSVPELANDLSKTADAVKKLTSTTAALKLTAGFSGGVGDLKLVFDDLKSGKLKSLVAKGKDTKDLQKSLSSLANIHNGLEMSVKFWLQLSIPKRTDSPKKLASILADILGNNQKSSDTAVLANSLGPLKDCFKDLKLPDVIPDFKEATVLSNFAKNLGIQLGVLKQFLETQKTAIESVLTAINPLKTLMNPILTNTSTAAFKVAWYGIRNSNKTAFIIKESKKIYGAYEKIKDQLPFDTVQKSVDLSVITAVLKISNGTNLDVMISCLQKNSYDSNLMGTTLNFGKSVQAMKRKKTEYNSTQTFLTELSKMKSELQKVEQLAKPNQQPKPRRRRAPNQKSLANLKNAPTVAADLGRGVQVLREFAKILENEASVQVAVNADDGLKNAISAIPGVQSVWTDENRKGMGKMVVDLKELDKFAGSVKMDNMTSLWQIFDEAQKTDGVVGVDAKVFNDPISIVLAASSDSKIKGVSGDFKNLGALDLDFAQHKINLKAASFTLQPLQQFFDDYFGNTKASGGTVLRTVTVSTSDSGTLYTVFGVLGGIGLVAGVGAVGYYLMKRRKRKEQEKSKRKEMESRWGIRERHWIYEEFYNLNDSATDPVLAVQDGRLNRLKDLIKKGALLDVYHDGRTAFHLAVVNGSPEAVELLIRAGADRNMISDENQTPMEFLEECLMLEEHKASWAKMRAVKAMFKKYENRKFKSKIRDLLPQNEFNIKIMSNDPKLKALITQFEEMYDQNLVKEGSLKVTHTVFDTDKDGIFDFDTLPVDIEKDRDNIAYYSAILNYTVAVKTSWLTECLKDRANMYTDYEHRITKIRVNGKVYETLDEWKKWMCRRCVKCLTNVEFFYCWYGQTEQFEPMELFEGLIGTLGGIFMREPQMFSETPRPTLPLPFWHKHMNRRWLVYHPDEQCHDMLFDDIEKRSWRTPSLVGVKYEVKTVKEFFEFLFSMNGYKDLTRPPVEPTRTTVNVPTSTQKAATSSDSKATNK